MKRPIACLLCLAVACDKKPADAPKELDPAKPATGVSASPSCGAKLEALEPWLAKLDIETKSHEIDFGPKLQVIDREPMPVEQRVDAVEIRKSSIRAWDINQHDHAETSLPENATPKQLADFLTKMHDQKASDAEFLPASDDLVRVDVDREAKWGDVTHVIDAATKAGYHRAVFAFTATSKLTPPAGIDDATKTEAAAKTASDRLETLGTNCKPLGRLTLRHHPSTNDLEDAAAIARETTAALRACNCAADPDELRKLKWIDARWHQAVARVGVEIQLDAAAPTTIVLSAKTAWSEAHAALLKATGPVKLAAK
jgi:hypothetical protein